MVNQVDYENGLLWWHTWPSRHLAKRPGSMQPPTIGSGGEGLASDPSAWELSSAREMLLHPISNVRSCFILCYIFSPNFLLWSCKIWRYAALDSLNFFSIWLKLLFWRGWCRQEVRLVKRKKIQNKTAFCERNASDSLPVDQNHSTIKINTDRLYFGCYFSPYRMVQCFLC